MTCITFQGLTTFCMILAFNVRLRSENLHRPCRINDHYRQITWEQFFTTESILERTLTSQVMVWHRELPSMARVIQVQNRPKKNINRYEQVLQREVHFRC